MAATIVEACQKFDVGLRSIADSANTQTSPTPPTVRIPTHTLHSHDQLILGRVSELTSSVEEFRGIPYGIVPRRWEHSLLRTSLPEDVFNASHHGPKCPQPAAPNNSDIYQSHIGFPEVGESETDCLNLFIVRPSPAALSKAGCDPVQGYLPVYFYIHGGGFGFGAGTDPIWDPTRLVQHSLALRKPVIAVVINYRLNLFGFAASSSIIAAQKGVQLKGCNFGIHDQKIALKWVSQNISSFGGDPLNITIGGQSAGGCSVHTHVLEARSSSESPLFKRAIIQSGAFTSVGIGPVPLEACEKRWHTLCDYFELTDQPECQRMEVLQNMPATDLIRAAGDLGWMVFFLANDNLTITALSDDYWTINFDQNDNRDANQDNNPAEPIQVLIGDTEAEGSVFIANALPKLQSYEQIDSIFQEAYSSDSEANAVLRVYGIEPRAGLPALHKSLIRFITDVTFGYSIYSAHQNLSIQSHGNETQKIDDASIANKRATTAQLYKIEFGNPFPGPSYEVAHHCVDLIYIFEAFHDDLEAQDGQSSGYDAAISNSALTRDMQSTWINFIVGNGKDVREDMCLVFGKDRVARMENLGDNPKWVERRRRFNLIAAHRREASTVMDRIFALAR